MGLRTRDVGAGLGTRPYIAKATLGSPFLRGFPSRVIGPGDALRRHSPAGLGERWKPTLTRWSGFCYTPQKAGICVPLSEEKGIASAGI